MMHTRMSGRRAALRNDYFDPRFGPNTENIAATAASFDIASKAKETIVRSPRNSCRLTLGS
jgi:hypothetical protein